jgi:hypothetical protein
MKLYRVEKRAAKAPFQLARPQDFYLSYLKTVESLPPEAIPYWC